MVHRLAIPSSTPQSIIFPYDGKTKKFSTSNYMPIQTQNRASLEEIEQFLDQVSAPIKEWQAESEEGSGMIVCLFIICMIIFPLLVCFICWLSSVGKKSEEKLKEASEKAKLFVRDNNQQFIEKGLSWNFPSRFPHWIELWTSLEGPSLVGFGGFQRPGIQIMPMPQQSYQNQQGYLMNQNESQNQYNGNTFGGTGA